MKRLISILLVAVFLSSLVVIPNTTASQVPGIAEQLDRPFSSFGEGLEGIDATPRFEGLVIDPGVEPDTGNPWWVPLLDDYYGFFYWQDFECVLNGTYANIWIGLAPEIWDNGTHFYQDAYIDNGPAGFSADDEWHFVYPWSYDGSVAGFTGEYIDVIYGENLTYVLNEFDNNIHDKVTNQFGMYADRPGPFGDYKIQILIFNIRDGMFWDPVSAPWFIEGYFWSFASNYNNANIFHMDVYQWYRRLGPDPQPDPRGYPPRPLEYEGTFAHEFQHLVHYDVDSDEMSWVNEGCSTLAEWICGYGFSPGHLSEYFYWYWDTSLVIWESYLANYGVVFLWHFYMYEHYGGTQLIWDLAHEQANGIEGWSNVLAEHRIKKTFDEIFEDWAIANYLDDTSFMNGIYGYYNLDIGSEHTDYYDLQFFIWAWEFSYPMFFDTQVDVYPNMGHSYPFGLRLPYIVNYVEFYNGAPELQVYFDGDDYTGVVPSSGMYEWHSDGTAWSWYRLSQTFDLTSVSTATLEFMTYYEIELDWDYGYVEVHDLDTDEWYTLPGVTTVTDVGYNYGTDNPNCPDPLEPTAYFDAGRWNGFTGSSFGWYQETMDLTMFAGHQIELYFTYWTDPYTLELGWYVDDIEIPEIGFFDNVESGPSGWTVNAGWYITTGVIMNDFEVNFIETTIITKGPMTRFLHHISPMALDEETEADWENLKVADTIGVQSYAVMVAANQPGHEHTFGTDYYFVADIVPFG